MGHIASMTSQPDANLQPGELDGQVGPFAYGTAELQAIALEAGIPNSAWSFPPELQAFALLIVERCASIGDKYSDRDSDSNAGEEIRATFGLG